MKELTTKAQKQLFKKVGFVASPRSRNYLTVSNNNSIAEINLPFFTVHQEALLDFCFHLLRKQVLDSEKELPIITGEEIVRVQKHLERFPKDLGATKFKTKEFRDTTGLKRRTDKQIIKDIEFLYKSSIQARMVKVFYEKGGHTAIDWASHIFSDRVIEKTDKIAPRTKNPQHSILVVWGLLTGLIFYNDIKKNRICLFSKKYYSKMSHPAQKILRYLSLWNHKKLTLEESIDLLGWKITKVSGIAKRFESYFNELKNMEFILDWERIENTKGLKMTWEFFGIKTTRELDVGRKELLLDKKGE